MIQEFFTGMEQVLAARMMNDLIESIHCGDSDKAARTAGGLAVWLSMGRVLPDVSVMRDAVMASDVESWEQQFGKLSDPDVQAENDKLAKDMVKPSPRAAGIPLPKLVVPNIPSWYIPGLCFKAEMDKLDAAIGQIDDELAGKPVDRKGQFLPDELIESLLGEVLDGLDVRASLKDMIASAKWEAKSKHVPNLVSKDMFTEAQLRCIVCSHPDKCDQHMDIQSGEDGKTAQMMLMDLRLRCDHTVLQWCWRQLLSAVFLVMNGKPDVNLGLRISPDKTVTRTAMWIVDEFKLQEYAKVEMAPQPSPKDVAKRSPDEVREITWAGIAHALQMTASGTKWSSKPSDDAGDVIDPPRGARWRKPKV